MKHLLLIRHGQALHNLLYDARDRGEMATAEVRNKVNSDEATYRDAPLTDEGKRQAVARGRQLAKQGKLDQVQLWIVSPMRRTIQTFLGVVEGAGLDLAPKSAPLPGLVRGQPAPQWIRLGP